MRWDVMRGGAGIAFLFTLLFSGTGCTELYFVFGPGGLFPPDQGSDVSGGGGGGGSSTSGPTVIPSPIFLSDQADPLLEATAGATVVVAAQLNDDNLDGVIDDNDEVDFVSGSYESQPIQIHLNQGGGVAFTTYSIAGGGPIARMVDLEVADFDVDGRPDVAVLINDTGFTPVGDGDLRGAVVLLFAPADPSDALSWTQVTINATFILPSDSTGMTDFAVADIDQVTEADGVTPRGPDIVLGSNESGDVEKYIRLYMNPGFGGGPVHGARSGAAWGAGSIITFDAVPIQALKVADIDGDGDGDIVATFPTAKTYNVRWLENPLVPAGVGAVAAGNWTRTIVGQQQDGANYLDVGDLDGDGDIDVAVAKTSEGLVQWFQNPDRPAEGVSIVGIQNFPWSVYNLGRIQGGYTINQIQVVDLNRDGRQDCFLTASGNMVGFQPGTQIYNYWQAFSIVATNPVATIGRCAFADVNEDNRLDIIAPLDRTGLSQDQILIFRRLSP